MTTEAIDEDDTFGSEESINCIVKALGAERKNRVLAGRITDRTFTWQGIRLIWHDTCCSEEWINSIVLVRGGEKLWIDTLYISFNRSPLLSIVTYEITDPRPIFIWSVLQVFTWAVVTRRFKCVNRLFTCGKSWFPTRRELCAKSCPRSLVSSWDVSLPHPMTRGRYST